MSKGSVCEKLSKIEPGTCITLHLSRTYSVNLILINVDLENKHIEGVNSNGHFMCIPCQNIQYFVIGELD